jgi:two-component system, NarL family, nitrate/nitrite response regulator NarL
MGGKAGASTFVVVDDHRTFADLLGSVLSTEEDLSCVGVAYDLATGVELIRTLVPDLVVMDVKFDGDTRDGLAAAADIRERTPGVRVVLLTGHTDEGLIRRAAEAGASALVPKNGSLEDLMKTLRMEPPDGLFVHPQLLASLVMTLAAPSQRALPRLSRRERDVLAMMMIGHDARKIAGQLGISLATCRGYIKSLLVKLGAHSQLEAVAIARRHGLADVEATP